MTTKFTVPKRGEVSEKNQAIFDSFQRRLGFTPNLYAYMAKSEHALGSYLNFQNSILTLNSKEKEVVNLVTSQINGCRYCLSAHTVSGKMTGFSDDEILEIRRGSASFNPKLDALAKLTAAVVTGRGKTEEETSEAFFRAGYTEANLIDVTMLIGIRTIANMLHNLTAFEIDFPLAAGI